MKTKTILYWSTTTLLALVLVAGGGAQLFRQPDAVAGLLQLGYPAYFASLLGSWKVLGAVALLAPGFARLKEWAYAGIFFEMTGAAVSHAAVGDCGAYAFHLIVPLLFAAMTLVSWKLRPAGRLLPAVAA